ncbi:MAG: FHA domain-containing protein, partial [Myxococcales bacterium]|nr:FHA domain-containing protein [Myxococcales bacterium]
MTAAPAPRLRRDPRYVAEFAELLRSMGPTSFKREFKRSMLVGYGLVSQQVDRPHGWRRRTLPSGDVSDEVEAVQSLVDRVWPVRKDPGGASGPKVLLGASAECDIVVPDYSISTRHCGFSFEPGRILITDLDSLNGTF